MCHSWFYNFFPHPKCAVLIFIGDRPRHPPTHPHLTFTTSVFRQFRLVPDLARIAHDIFFLGPAQTWHALHATASPALMKSREISRNLEKSQKSLEISGILGKSREISGNLGKSRKISENLRKSRKISENLRKSREISGNLGKSREIFGNLGKSR